MGAQLIQIEATATELRLDLGYYLRQVKGSDLHVRITRHGKPVAVIIPMLDHQVLLDDQCPDCAAREQLTQEIE